MNLAYRYPIIFWNCACLITDSGGTEIENEEDEYIDVQVEETYYNEMEEFTDDDSEEDIEDSYDEEDCDGYPAEVCKLKDNKKKKKVKATNYGKISTAIGKMVNSGVTVVPPDINKSTYTFSPDADNNIIRFGMSGITRVGQDLIVSIIANRPYTSLQDFISKVKINKPQMINLIKSGAFDCFGERTQVMREYINLISDTKKRITLQNMKMLIDFGLIPDDFDMERRVYNYNKYLKKFKNDIYYDMDNIALTFYEKNFSIDDLTTADTESGFKIKQTIWDKIYKKYMDNIRPYIKENNQFLLDSVNDRLTKDMWNKYCLGTISQWEMESVSCYFHEHELAKVNNIYYDFSNFSRLNEEPEIERTFQIKGKTVPIFKLHRICGTVLDRNKAKKTISLLTTDGVVTVRIFGDVFSYYDKQISEKDSEGHKHVIEKSIFHRGNKIIITGIRRDSDFVAKKYKSTPYHLVELITEINDDGTIKSRGRIEQ